MALPVLIDVDMVADGAAALCLALASEALDVRAVVASGGVVSSAQSVENAQRILGALKPRKMPLLAQGCDPEESRAACKRLCDFGGNGLCDVDISADDVPPVGSYLDAYRDFLAGEGPRWIVTAAPLTTLAAVLADMPDALSRATGVCVCGGAVWTQGNVDEHSEFNIGRDPDAAAAVLVSGLPMTVAPLDVTNYICLDASNLAHLSASGYRTGEVAAGVLEPLLDQENEAGRGKTHVAPVVALASVIWPDLFLKTRMRLDVVTDGDGAGRCKPGLGGDKSKQIDLLTAVNAVDLLENILESMCHEEFVV